MGDFRQLDPVRKQPLYKDKDHVFRNSVNCFLELVGRHRFQEDPEWGELLAKFRDGTVNEQDIKLLNDEIWIGGKKEQDKDVRLPDNIKYATFNNDDRDSINTALFEKALMHNSSDPEFGLLVFAGKVKIKDSTNKFCMMNNWNLLWNNVTENGAKFHTSSKRMDPVLKLYRGMRVMLTENKNVAGGIANGTQAIVQRVVLKRNEAYDTTTVTDERQLSLNVKSVLAHQIDYIELRHVNDKVTPAVFRMKPQEFTFKADLPSPLDRDNSKSGKLVTLKATQLPVISNDATTGHKLQGCSVQNLFVHEWSHTCKNWIYVVLSRVKTRIGLFCRDRVPTNLSLYAVPEELEEMMEYMDTKRPNSATIRHGFLEIGPSEEE